MALLFSNILRSTVTYVLNLYNVEIYERTCIILERKKELTHMRSKYVAGLGSILNLFVGRIVMTSHRTCRVCVVY